jgi:hypothetical protein
MFRYVPVPQGWLSLSPIAKKGIEACTSVHAVWWPSEVEKADAGAKGSSETWFLAARHILLDDARITAEESQKPIISASSKNHGQVVTHAHAAVQLQSGLDSGLWSNY